MKDVHPAREFDTVNGIPARVGSLGGPGATVSGRVFVSSGYASLGFIARNQPTSICWPVPSAWNPRPARDHLQGSDPIPSKLLSAVLGSPLVHPLTQPDARLDMRARHASVALARDKRV